MKQVRLRIRKKTLVPTTNAIAHEWRSDWKMAGVIDYSDSDMFNRIGGGPIKNDAQFAKFLHDRLGDGIYSLLLWKHGTRGFSSFMKIELKMGGFKRLPKTISQDKKDKTDNILEIKNLNKKINHEEDETKKSELQEEVEDLMRENNINNDLIKLEKGYSCSQYLTSTRPIYKFHSYDAIVEKESIESVVQEQVEEEGIWV